MIRKPYTTQQVLNAVSAHLAQLLLDERTRNLPLTAAGWNNQLSESFRNMQGSTGADATQNAANHIAYCIFFIIWNEMRPRNIDKLREYITVISDQEQAKKENKDGQ